MKKNIFSIILLLSILTNSYSQIGILGTALGGYDVPDTDLIQTNATDFTLENQTFTTGTVKFRQGNNWTINWGSTTFPAGVGVQDGPEIPVPAGTYNIYFRITGLYNFFAHENIGIIGTAVSDSGFNGEDINLHTSDGINFSIASYPFKTGELKFRKDDAWNTNWGSSSFPSGIGTNGGVNIPVTAGTYTLTFNINTGAYSFLGTPSYPNIGIIGTAVSTNGYSGEDTNLTTTDGITYTLSDYTFTDGTIKFRQDDAWTTNWGGSNFPNGIATLNSNTNIPVPAGTYTVSFNITNGSYTFIGNSFPSIGIWGPAVNSQLGYVAPDIDMTTKDGITYTLSGFYFSSGNAYFRQDNNQALVWGATNSFPNGIATFIGPPLFIPGGEYFVTYNRITGEYHFSTPSIGILGTALNGYLFEDTDLTTTDGFSYSISNLTLTDGTVKFRKDNLWTSNWGANTFPNGTGIQDGPEIPVTAGVYNVTFEKSTGNYIFQKTLSTIPFKFSNIKVYPNPSESYWNFIATDKKIEYIEILNVLGKTIISIKPNASSTKIDTTQFTSGLYFAKITDGNGTETIKLVKN